MINKDAIAVLLLVLLTIAIRIPPSMSVVGLDSHQNQHAVDNLASGGYLNWNYNALSLFGFTTLSYPSGEIYYAAVASTMSGVPSEYIILIISIVISLVAFFATYAILSDAYNKKVAFFGSLCLGIAPYFVFLTSWSISTRALLIALIPCFIFCLRKFDATRKPKYLVVALAILILGNLTHRTGLFLLIILAIFVVSHYVYPKYRSIVERHDKSFITAYIVLAASFFALQFTSLAIYNPSLDTYKHSTFLSGSSQIVIFVNFLINYITGNGILVVLSIIGVGWLLFRRREKFDIFLLLTFLLACNFFIDKIYFRAVFIFFLAVLTGIGAERLLSIFQTRHKVAASGSKSAAIMAIFLIISTAFSLLVINRSSVLDVDATPITTNARIEMISQYIRTNYNNPTMISADGTLTHLVIADAGAESIDTSVFEKKNVTELDWNNENTTIANILMRIPDARSKIKMYFQDWLLNDGESYYTGRHEYALKRHGLDTSIGRKIVDYYGLDLLLTSTSSNTRNIALVKDAAASRNKIYTNEEHEIYALGYEKPE